MEALTSFELEAQRRRETVISDRRNTVVPSTGDVEPARAIIIEPVVVRHREALVRASGLGEGQAASIVRQSVG